ncbi:MAG: hypothetical protein U9O98_10850 [Asgard group archaeon]|nr:hypothetical protein [Asgard group archaeon]
MGDSKNCSETFSSYSRKLLYLLLTVPILVVIGAVSYYLFTVRVIWGIIYLSLYFLIFFFQSFYCVHINCPYVGRFCPAIAGIFPASFLAKLWIKLNMRINTI